MLEEDAPGQIFGDCEQECTRLSTLQQGKTISELDWMPNWDRVTI